MVLQQQRCISRTRQKTATARPERNYREHSRKYTASITAKPASCYRDDSQPLPRALARKYKNAPFEWKWFFVFPATRTCKENPKLRHHTHETVLQKKLREAVRAAGINKRATCHTLRHSFCTHLLMDGYDIKSIAELAGHKDVRTTMVYLHTIKNSRVRSPIDAIS